MPPLNNTPPTETDESLRAEQFHLLAESIPHMIWTARADGAIDRCNRHFLNYLDKTLEQVQGWNWIQTVHPDDRQRITTAWQQAVQNGEELRSEVRINNPRTGEYRWFATQATPQRDSAGRMIRWFGICTDIDDCKRAQEELRRSEERQRFALESARAAIWEWDMRTDRVIWSANAEAVFGLARGVPGETYETSFQAIHPEDRELLRTAVERAVKGEADYALEFRMIRSNGEVIWVYDRGRVWRDAEGRPVRMAGVFADITERKRAVEALKKSEQGMARAQRIAQMGNWEWDLITDEVRWSDEIYRIFGLRPREFGASYQAFLERVHPEDHQLIFKAVEATLGQGAPYSVDHRVILPDGTLKTVNEQAEVVYDAAGKPILFLGTVLDITERKRAEEALQSVAEFPNQNPAPVLRIGRDGTVLYANQAAAILGNQGIEQGRRAPADLHESVLEVLRANSAREIDVKCGERVFSFVLAPMADHGYVNLYGRDITERQRDEESLRRSERRANEAAEFNRRLLQELDHRVRNNLAGLLSLVMLMRRRCGDVNSFAEAMEARLMSMVHAHHLMTRDTRRATTLKILIVSLLEAMKAMARHTIDVAVEGPEVSICECHVQPLILVLQEWYTNSCKYGAHSVAGGRLSVTWEAQAEGAKARVRLRWRESGAGAIAQPVQPSLGTELVRSFVTRELGGLCQLRFDREGVDHTIEFTTTPGGSLDECCRVGLAHHLSLGDTPRRDRPEVVPHQ